MTKAQLQQVAAFLLDAQEAVWGWDGAEAMMRYLHQLHEIIHRMRNAKIDRDDRDMRFGVALLTKKARRLRRRIEERLRLRN